MRNFEKKIKFFLSKLFDIKKENFDINPKEINQIVFHKVDWRIGEYIVSSFMFREIKNKYPHIKLIVFSGGNEVIKLFIKNNKNIDKFYIYDRKNRKEKNKQYKLFLKEVKKNVSIFFDMEMENKIKLEHLLLIRKINAHINIGYNKENYKIYNKKILKNEKRICENYKEMIEKLDLKNINLKYDIPKSNDFKEEINIFFKKNDINKAIAINFFGSTIQRKLNTENALIILKKLQEYYKEYKLIILNSPSDTKKIEEILKKCDKSKVFYYNKSNNILSTIEIIRKSEIVVTPDTSIVHIAEGLNKKIIAFYHNDKNNFNKYGIFTHNSKIIFNEGNVNLMEYEKIDLKI